MTRTLRDISEDIAALEDLLMEVGGDITDEEADAAVDEWLTENRGALKSKVDGYATLIMEMEDRAKARRDEARRLHGLAGTDENAAKRMKERLTYFMLTHNERKIETDYHRLWIQKNGGKTPMFVEEGLLPKEYMKEVTTYVVDQEKLRADLEAGKEIPGAKLLEKGHHLRVK
jgi:hypothetical protein